MAFFFFQYFLMDFLFICVMNINFQNNYNYQEVSSFDLINLDFGNDRNYTILKFINNKFGDIIFQSNKQVDIFVYNNINDIKIDGKGDFIDYNWNSCSIFNFYIHKNDKKFIEKADYFFIILSKNSSITVKIFNEFDVKSVENKNNFSKLSVQSKEILHEEILKTNFTNDNCSYLYYINISNYNINEENVIEIEIPADENLKQFFSIKNELINEKSEIKEPKNFLFDYSLRNIKGNLKYYFFLPFKKLNQSNKFFIFSINYSGEYNITSTIYLPKRIEEIKINNKNISNCHINTSISNDIRKYIKLKFSDGFPKKENVFIFIKENKASILYQGNLFMKDSNLPNNVFHLFQLFIVAKDSKKKENLENTITIGLKGDSGNVEIQIKIDSHNIIFNYEPRSSNKVFFLELINCNDELILVENYDNDIPNYNHLLIEELYGEYNLSYNTPIDSIDFLDTPRKKVETDIISIESQPSIFYSLKCKAPTNIKLKYIKDITKENYKKKILEGEEILGNLKENIEYELNTNVSNILYIFHIESKNKIQMKYNQMTYTIDKNNPFTDKIANKETNPSFSIEKKDKQDKNSFFQFYLTSTYLYSNIIEGNNEIEYSKKKVSFKFRKDILYDYVTIEIIPKKGVKKIFIYYDYVKIKEEEGKFYIPNPSNYYYFENNYIFKFSNPYNKFHNKIKEDEFIFFLIDFKHEEKDFNIFINIRYYYNNKIQNLNERTLTPVYINTNYRIFGDEFNENKSQVLIMNINKCNKENDYSLFTFYENDNNLIANKKIPDDITFIFQENLYNNTYLIINQLNSSNGNFSSDDLLINFFYTYKEVYDLYLFEEKLKINLTDNGRKVNISWSKYLFFEDIDYEVSTNYSLYILPKNSTLNGFCAFINEEPNITISNQTNIELYLSPGDYKINIISYSLEEDYPSYSIYEELIINIPPRSILSYIILIIIGLISLIILIFFIYKCWMKKKKKHKKYSSKTGYVIMNSLEPKERNGHVIINEELIHFD